MACYDPPDGSATREHSPLRALQTGGLCQHDRFLCQKELQKAIARCSGTGWAPRWLPYFPLDEMTPRIDDMTITLRDWTEADAAALAQLANDRRIWLGLRDAFPHPYGLADARRFIALASAMAPRTYFAIVDSGALAGGIGYTLHTDVERVGAEVGYWIAVQSWGRGIATAALRQLTALAFTRHPDLRRLYAVPYTTNAASARVLEKAGYTCEGTLRESAIKDGRVLDQFMYSILRREASFP